MKPFFITVPILVLIALGVGAFFLLKGGNGTQEPGPSEDPFGNGAVSGGGNVTPPSPSLTVTLANGLTASVPDFTKEDQPEVASPENGYQVGGSAESDYQVLYFPQDSYFLLTIFAEPIGPNRLSAEAELRSRLKLSNDELCALNADVFVTADANETYAGTNLGLSFCPGAVPLPS